MTRWHATNFNPPTAQQVIAHIDRYPPTGPARWVTMMPMIVLGVVVGLTFLAHETLALLLPALVLAGWLGAMSWQVRNLRELERRTALAGELALTRQYPQALRLAWRLLPNLRAMPELHGRTISVMAWCLEQVKSHEAAIAAYDYLISHLPAGHPGAMQFTIERTVSQLMCDRLADADDALRRLRGHLEGFTNSPIAAHYRFASLLQQIQTNHFADAIEAEDSLIDDLRPLGVDAGYGYALMALSHQKLLDHGGEAGVHAAKVSQWWGRATLLLPVTSLIGRYQLLGDLRDHAPQPIPQEVRAR